MKTELEQRIRPEVTKKTIDDLIGKVKVVKDAEYYSSDPAAPAGEIKKP